MWYIEYSRTFKSKRTISKYKWFPVSTNENITPPNIELLHIAGQPIEKVEHTQYLVVFLDHKITGKNMSITFPVRLQGMW